VIPSGVLIRRGRVRICLGVALEEVIKELIKDHEESVIHHNELVKKVSDIHGL
jgi:hypothetical protein